MTLKCCSCLKKIDKCDECKESFCTGDEIVCLHDADHHICDRPTCIRNYFDVYEAEAFEDEDDEEDEP